MLHIAGYTIFWGVGVGGGVYWQPKELQENVVCCPSFYLQYIYTHRQTHICGTVKYATR